MTTTYSIIEGRKNKKMPDGNNSKLVYQVIGMVITVAISVGSVVACYFKALAETNAKINAVELRHQEVMNRLDLLENNLSTQMDWAADSLNRMAKDEIPNAIKSAVKEHEYNMHPKAATSPGSPTDVSVTIGLPKRPKDVVDVKYIKKIP